MTTVQDHIHLDRPTQPHDADGAPAYRWKAQQRATIPSVQVAVARSFNGHTYMSRVVNAEGDPVIHTDWRYQLRVTVIQYDYLKSLLGMELEFVDHRHVDDGEDHTDYIKMVGLREVSDIKNLDPLLRKFDVTIELVDLEDPNDK